jgi:hypothetical protein
LCAAWNCLLPRAPTAKTTMPGACGTQKELAAPAPSAVLPTPSPPQAATTKKNAADTLAK